MAELAVIDGDTVAFRAAAMNERRSIVVTHKPTGRTSEFDNRTAFKEHIGTKWDILDFDIEDKQTPEDIRYALGAAKATIKSICEKLDTSNYKVVMSGEGNFRLDIPLPKRYKHKRPEAKPLQLKAVRDYLIKHHAADVTSGCEADDVLAQWAWRGFKEGKEIVQCSQDKDAYSNAGYLYNFVKDEDILYISGLGELHLEGTKVKGTSRKWEYAQIMLGDSVDCYKPTDLCKVKFGDKSVYNLLVDLKTDKECWEAMACTYKLWYPEPVCYKAWDGVEHTKDYLDILQMYVDCAHMRRWENDRVIVKDVLTKLKIDF